MMIMTTTFSVYAQIAWLHTIPFHVRCSVMISYSLMFNTYLLGTDTTVGNNQVFIGTYILTNFAYLEKQVLFIFMLVHCWTWPVQLLSSGSVSCWLLTKLWCIVTHSWNTWLLTLICLIILPLYQMNI